MGYHLIRVNKGVEMIKNTLSFFVFLCLIPQWSMALDLDESRHFLLRTGHAVTQDNLTILAGLDREEAVEWLLEQLEQEEQRTLNLPGWYDQPPMKFNKNRETRKQFKRRLKQRIK